LELYFNLGFIYFVTKDKFEEDIQVHCTNLNENCVLNCYSFTKHEKIYKNDISYTSSAHDCEITITLI